MTKWYYDRWINAISLEPGDLVLLKAGSYQEERKIKHHWEDMLPEVEHLITNDVPLYIVKDKIGQSQILHQTDFSSLLGKREALHCVWVYALHGQDYQFYPRQTNSGRE